MLSAVSRPRVFSAAFNRIARLSSRDKRLQPNADDVCFLLARGDPLLSTFKPQGIANTLWALASLRHNPGEAALGRFVAAAEPQLGAFKPQNITNTLWALATLGHHPGEAALGLLVAAAEPKLGAFKPQGIANTLWALATLGHQPGEAALGRM
jgi:hypothetical protein